MTKFHLTQHVTELIGVIGDHYGHIGEEIGWLRSINRLKIPITRFLLILLTLLILLMFHQGVVPCITHFKNSEVGFSFQENRIRRKMVQDGLESLEKKCIIRSLGPKESAIKEHQILYKRKYFRQLMFHVSFNPQVLLAFQCLFGRMFCVICLHGVSLP
eukprot:sb/3472989/